MIRIIINLKMCAEDIEQSPENLRRAMRQVASYLADFGAWSGNINHDNKLVGNYSATQIKEEG